MQESCDVEARFCSSNQFMVNQGILWPIQYARDNRLSPAFHGSARLGVSRVHIHQREGKDPKCGDLYCVVVLIMERAREMLLLSGVLLYLANSVCSQGTPVRSV